MENVEQVSYEEGQKIASDILAFFSTRQYLEALPLAQSLVAQFPLNGFAWKALGTTYHQLGRYVEAIAPMLKSLELAPTDINAMSNLGVTYRALGQLPEAEAIYRKALNINPSYAQAHCNLGVTLRDLGRLSEAQASCQTAIQLAPHLEEAHTNLGTVLKDSGQATEAEACYRHALLLNPNSAEAYSNLGDIQKQNGRFGDATHSYQTALRLRPNDPIVFNNFGVLSQEIGNFHEAADYYQRALKCKPNFAEAFSNLLFMQHYAGTQSASSMLADAQQYGDMVSQQACPYTTWDTALGANKVLHIGLVSGDLSSHPVGYFVESVLACLAADFQDKLFVTVFQTRFHTDAVTERLKGHCRAWYQVVGLSDQVLAQQIHAERIDILIDLSGHTAHNRLPMFAWKPAPIQLSWLGYFASTGVAAIDYLIADPYTLPVSEERNFTETIARLPETRLCFTPPPDDIAVSALPSLKSGYVTFGCFSNLTKVNNSVIALWSKILLAVPGSRILIKAKQLNSEAARDHLRTRFADHHIDAGRIHMEGAGDRAAYLAAYHHIDMMLDTFPYPGGTTTVEAVWMGVPVLTLEGQNFLGRQGVGILMNLDLPDWIAVDEQDYLGKVITHAKNLPQLAVLRSGLRQRLLNSPLVDAHRFAGNFEETLRRMWAHWCD